MDPCRQLLLPFPLVAGLDNLWDDRLQKKMYLNRREGCETNFKSLYRFTPEHVDFLAETFLDDYSETRGGALSNVQKMKCFLRYVGDPGFQVLKNVFTTYP